MQPRQLASRTKCRLTLHRTRTPKSHLGRVCRYPHGRECTRLLRVLAVQCPLQTSPVTQPRVHYIQTMIPHQSLDTTLLTILIPLQPVGSIQQA